MLAGSLSYGQRKLLELAYVLVADPAVILLDEPAGGVNPTLINLITDRIRQLNAEQGKTFLLVEHNMEFVMGLCSVITVLESGAAVVSGPPDIVRTDKRVLDAYLGVDLDEDDGPPDAGQARRRPGTGGHPMSEPLLAMDGVVAGYGGGDVLRGVSFTVPEGSITCVVGPNGAGKSTVMRVISGLLRPRLGTVTLRGERLNGKSPRQILDLGVVQVPQNHSLFTDMTVHENIDLGGYTIRDRSQVAKRIDAVYDLFPQVRGWARMKAGSLSGGQQRLVEFAQGADARPGAHPARRAVDGPVTAGAQVGVRRRAADERQRRDRAARGAERQGRAQALAARRRHGERHRPAGRHGPRGPRAPRDRRTVPRRLREENLRSLRGSADLRWPR